MVEPSVERFKPTAGYWVGLLGMVGLVVAAVITVTTSQSLVAITSALGMVWFALVCWVTLMRPAVHAHADHLLLRNMLRDTEVPWHLVEDVAIRQTTRVYVDEGVHHGLGLSRSTQQMMRSSLPQRQGQSSAARFFGLQAVEAQAQQPTLHGIDVSSIKYADFVEIRLMELAKERAERSRPRTEVVRRWVWVETAAVVGLLLLTVALGLLA